jgi:hypothetical protein
MKSTALPLSSLGFSHGVGDYEVHFSEAIVRRPQIHATRR